MLKNYIVNEVITMEMATSISSININEHFYEFIPYNVDLVKSINHYLQAYKSTKIHSDISDELEHFLNYKDL